MNDLFIKPTAKTPKIIFRTSGQLTITGNSYPENVVDYYEPVFKWLEEFLEGYYEPVSLTIDLTYINTSSVKCLLDIITKVGALTKNELKINWIHEIDDDDMAAIGEDLERISSVKFDFVAR